MLAARNERQIVPISSMGPVRDNLDLISGGLSFTPDRAKQLVELFLNRMSGCGPDCGCGPVLPQRPSTANGLPTVAPNSLNPDAIHPVLTRFFERVLTGQAGAKDLLRITITNFLDPYNFDIRQVMKCCTHHVLPSGHVIPFCAYNTLYRTGHLKLPPIVG